MRAISYVFIFATLFAVSSCTKSPDYGQLSSNFVVATNVDQKVNFSNYKTYYVSDSIATVSTSNTDTIWNDANSKKLVDAVKQNMQSRGFTFVSKGSKPDLGINMVAVKILNVGVAYPGWGWGYPGYWDPWYWGWYYPYYYPWTITYAVTTGSLGIDMIDLKNVSNSNQKLSAVWTALMGGALGVAANDIDNGVKSINQAFTQSPTVKTN
jgi:hypothetical protein